MEKAQQAIVEGWQQGQLVEIAIADLSDTGEGVGRFQQRVVFVPDTVPGDQALIRLLHVKPQYAIGKLHQLLEPSPHRIRPHCIVADKCGGCQWQHIEYSYQLEAKRNQVIQALERIGGITSPCVAKVISAGEPFNYRNKVTYPLGMSASGRIKAGYYRKGSHQLVNLNKCPVQDKRLNPLLAEIKLDIQQQGWRVYDEKYHRGEVRHLSLRIARRTGEILLTLVVKSGNLPGCEKQAQEWLQRYPQLVGVCININPARSNVIFGSETRCLAGRPYVREEFAGLMFQLGADTFFQVNTEAAEALLQAIASQLNLQGNELLIDAYCGIGTFTLPLARQVRLAIGLEVQAAAVELAKQNAQANNLTNVKFYAGKVEKLLPTTGATADIVLLDPPRKGCELTVLETLLQTKPQRIVYISCKPATLARDLKILCQGGYKLLHVQPVDFFPQTSHVECAAFLVADKDK
ncbi:MAG: 23S rRNA (uracil(1939)-C(5))-methyltransferase RlmD [Oscillatoriaceae bacterium SKW80]|nr:23S rRNA (uracil(1939)-C(5))-methyltransferase RlmD [Oscillatoriaceae bacterium SKYG93]MCX8119817.1 23S rRNA (uracil(1939)-C(5))-methyltransferase RlmD [Oscillatoriaceae bacterium SKW80]MDW8452079.1 23S rRNA (uracil(1939)-C(5))-methyltransferase RlmD [Oscillatoriaceae cyanobacterium SKYGB_i_bin93]HIK27484.1 23S rRNA (uracil(1939)-C(5))-methyltransferase RlmD [Oscillatoriaceae cyanobacterium M7585_C2015_266]